MFARTPLRAMAFSPETQVSSELRGARANPNAAGKSWEVRMRYASEERMAPNQADVF